MPDPKVGANEILVRIAASGVCHSDLDIVEGRLERAKYPLTIGHEAAGYIEKIGEAFNSRKSENQGITHLKEGQKVLVYPTYGCGSCWYCIYGRDNLCQAAKSIGFEIDGSHADYLLVKSPRNIFPIHNLKPSEAAPIACAGITVYEAIKEYVLPRARPGCSALIIGVGGLGHIAIQILKKLTDLEVIAVDKNEQKLGLAQKLKADHVLEYEDKLLEKLRKMPNICATLDLVGTDKTLKLGYECLTTQGILVVIGAAGGILKYRGPDPKRREIVGPIIGSMGSMKELIEMAEKSKIKILHQEHPLEEIGSVLEKLRQGEILGRAILVP